MQTLDTSSRLLPEAGNLWEQDIRLARTDLAQLTRQIAVMLAAGVSLRRALEVSADGAVDENAGVVLHQILHGVEAGMTLSAAMARFPRIFRTVYLAMIEVGEQTGQLVRTLSRLADWLDKEEALSRQVRAAITYPAIVLCAAAFLTVAFFAFIFPGLAESLKSVSNLPAVTRVLIAISHAVRSPLLWLACFAVLLPGFGLASRSLNQPAKRLLIWRLLSKVPLLGHVLRDLAAYRFSSAMSIMLYTGVDILRSFRLASIASGGPAVLAHLDEGLEYLSAGGELWKFMRQHPDSYPPMMTGLVLVGEESAKLPQVFEKLERSLTEDTEYRLEILTSLLEPALMAFVAVMVGFLVIGVAMPLYGLVSTAL